MHPFSHPSVDLYTHRQNPSTSALWHRETVRELVHRLHSAGGAEGGAGAHHDPRAAAHVLPADTPRAD